MSVTAIRNGRAGHGTRQSLLASALTWLWPEPLEHNRRPVGAIWLNSLVGWMWPRPLQREFDGAGVRRAGLPRLMGWAWPNKLDIALTRGWRHSWLWSWIWPGRLMGPDGEICALAPWHPALQPEVCEVTSWRRRIARKGTVAGMMMAAAAVASPTLMEGNNPLDGGRLNAFVSGSGGGSEEQSGTGGGSATGGSGGGGGGGGGSDEGQGGGGVQTPAGPTDLPPPAPDNFIFDSGGQPGDSGTGGSGGGGSTSGDGGGVTFLDPPALAVAVGLAAVAEVPAAAAQAAQAVVAALAVVAAVSAAAVRAKSRAAGRAEAAQVDLTAIPLSPPAPRTTSPVVVGPVVVDPAVGRDPVVARVAFPTVVARSGRSADPVPKAAARTAAARRRVPSLSRRPGR